MHVVCEPGGCQPITDKYLEPTAECRSLTVVTPKDAIMCPYVVCNNTHVEGTSISPSFDEHSSDLISRFRRPTGECGHRGDQRHLGTNSLYGAAHLRGTARP